MLNQVLRNALHWPLDAVAEIQQLLAGKPTTALVIKTAVPFVAGALGAFVLFPVNDSAVKFVIFVSSAALANQPQLFGWIDKEVGPAPPPKQQRIPRKSYYQETAYKPPYPFSKRDE